MAISGCGFPDGSQMHSRSLGDPFTGSCKSGPAEIVKLHAAWIARVKRSLASGCATAV